MGVQRQKPPAPSEKSRRPQGPSNDIYTGCAQLQSHSWQRGSTGRGPQKMCEKAFTRFLYAEDKGTGYKNDNG